MDTVILEYLKNHLISSNNIIIDNLIDICENNINLGLNKPIQNKSLITLNDIKCNNTNKGKIFEHFCFFYLILSISSNKIIGFIQYFLYNKLIFI